MYEVIKRSLAGLEKKLNLKGTWWAMSKFFNEAKCPAGVSTLIIN